jgi:hypothetical protein
MNVWLKFGGWFQCRLATDPDPCDEPRGVSGYVHAVRENQTWIGSFAYSRQSFNALTVHLLGSKLPASGVIQDTP